jgi:hypothetical protein
MAILAECDICGNQHRVKDAMCGNVVRCRECGVQIKVQRENFITSNSFVEENGRLRRREPEQKAGAWPWIVMGLVSCLVTCALIAAVWAFTILIRVH